MNDAPERSRPEHEPAAAPYMRLPMPLVALALFVFLAVLLAIGLWANRNLRPQGIVVPTPLPEASATSVPPVAAVATPTPAASAIVAATGTTAPTPLILTMASPTASPLPAKAAPTATPAPIAAGNSVTPLPTVEPILAAEVGKAYEDYWRVSSQALLELDATHLSDVMDGEYLMTFETNLESLRESGRAIKTQVSLNYRVLQANASNAVVIDRVSDDSFYVTPGTDSPLSEPANDVLRLQVTLRHSDGTWKVIESVSAD